MLGYLLGRTRTTELDRRAPRAHGPKATLGMEALEDRTVPTAFYTVPGAVGQTMTLDFTWVGRDAAFNNEIGVYVIDNGTGTVGGRAAGDPGYAQAALSTAAVVFRSGQGQGARNALTFASGSTLGFYMVQNGTTAQARANNPTNAPGRAGAPTVFFSFGGANADRFDHVALSTTANRTVVRFEDMFGGGDRDFNDAVIRFNPTAPTAVPGFAGQTTPTRFRLHEARGAFRSEVGLYMFDDAAGTVNGVAATDPGYAAAVLQSASRQVLFPRGAPAGTTSTANLPAAGTFGLYLIQNATAGQFLAQNPQNRVSGGPLTFFSFSPANPDGVEHVRRNPNALFFEDGVRGGDQDFNDVVVTFEYLATVGQPTAAVPPAPPAPPTVPPPPPPPAGDTAPPVVTAALTTDTADNTRPETQTDRVTSALGVSGTVTDDSAITALEARLGTTGAFTSILPSLAGTTYTISAAQLQALNNGTALPDGTYTVQVRATDAAGNTSIPTALTFTLARTAPAALLLAAGSDTGTQGEFRTETAVVDLTGTTTPFAQVILESQAVSSNPSGPPLRTELRRTTANASGAFVFESQSLAAGPNGFRAVIRDGAGNTNTAGATVTRNRAPQANAPTSGVAGTAGGTSTQNLTGIFSDQDTNTYVRFTVNQPTGPTTFDVQLFNSVTPGHATNFLAYANADDYDSTIIHRSATLTGGTPFVIQGGGFEFTAGANPSITNVATRPNVTNEPGLPNSKGTVALAKSTGVSSGNSQFFFNLNDNTAGGPALDSQNGGFTVFGQVVGSGQTVVDALAAVPVRDFSSGNQNSPFGTVPIRANPNNTPPINTLQDAQANNLVLFSDVSALTNPLRYTITANNNPAVVTNAVGSVVPANGSLVLNFGVAGTATVTVTATDPDGATATHTFNVTVT